MNLLLDTHIFLWYVIDDPQLPAAHRDAIRNTSNEVYLSAACVWEAVIKYSLGKLPLPDAPASYMPKQRMAHNMAGLPIAEEVMVVLSTLPYLHRDPFDRILISQALHHGMTLVTVDDKIRPYSVPQLPTS
jgi:PIN domain nuclease of toxin-antitoxin system